MTYENVEVQVSGTPIAANWRATPVWLTRQRKRARLTPKLAAPSLRFLPARSQAKAPLRGTSRAAACQSASASNLESQYRQPPSPSAGAGGCSRTTCETSWTTEFARRVGG